MKMNLLSRFTLSCFAIVLLVTASCGKKDDNGPDKKGANVTADLILDNGDKVDFSFSSSVIAPVVITEPEADGLSSLVMNFSHKSGGVNYSMLIAGRIKGTGIYHYISDRDEDEEGVGLALTTESNDGANVTFYGPEGVDHMGNFTLTVSDLTKNTIKGTFSGKLITMDGSKTVLVQNGKFRFDDVRWQK